jgi:hypothetical protein
MPRHVEPTTGVPIPFDLDDEIAGEFVDKLAVAGNTAEAKLELGEVMELDSDSNRDLKTLIEEAVQGKKTTNLTNTPVALASASFLRTYGQQLGMDAARIRAALTHKLMELADCGEPRFELKALELLGKHSDIALFTSRSEITVQYKDPDSLEKAIKERVKRLMNSDIEDVGVSLDLDDSLKGLFDPAKPVEGEFEEVEDEADKEDDKDEPS